MTHTVAAKLDNVSILMQWSRFSHATMEEHCERLTWSYGFIAADLLSPFYLTWVKYFPNNAFFLWHTFETWIFTLRAFCQSSAVHRDVFLTAHSSHAMRRWICQMIWKHFLHTKETLFAVQGVWTLAVCLLKSLRLEAISKIIKSNFQPNTTMPTKP